MYCSTNSEDDLDTRNGILCGVTSFGIGPCGGDGKFKPVYTNVASYVSWIKEQICKQSSLKSSLWTSHSKVFLWFQPTNAKQSQTLAEIQIRNACFLSCLEEKLTINVLILRLTPHVRTNTYVLQVEEGLRK